MKLLILAFSLFELIAALCIFFRMPLFTLIMAPKCKSSDAVSTCKPKRSRDIVSISEKVKILDMMEIEQKSYAEIGRLYGKNEFSIREVMKNKERISFLYRMLRIGLKRHNSLLSYVRDRERFYTVNVQHSVQYTVSVQCSVRYTVNVQFSVRYTVNVQCSVRYTVNVQFSVRYSVNVQCSVL
jgi:hypothetical protein